VNAIPPAPPIPAEDHPLLRLNAKIGTMKAAIYGVLILNAIGMGTILASVFDSGVGFVGGFLLGLIPILFAWPGLNFVEAWARINADRLWAEAEAQIE
jgi:hypothetical protein